MPPKDEPSATRRRPYLISTLAPVSSSFFLMVSASSFDTPSLTAFEQFDQVFRFFQAEGRNDFANDFDDVDFLVAGILQDDVELGLGFSSRAGGNSRASSGSNRCSSRNAPLLFEKLGEVGGFENGQSRTGHSTILFKFQTFQNSP